MTGSLIALVIGLPWLGAVVVWALGNRRPSLTHATAVAFSIGTAIISLILLGQTSHTPALIVPMGGYFGDATFVPDGLAASLAAIAAVVGSLAVIFAVNYMHGDPQLSRFYALVLLFIGAMTGLVLSGSLLFMFFFWEITALCSYGLISFYNDDPKAVAGGIKALVMTQVGGVGLLAGALMAYASLGSYQVSDLLEHAEAIPLGNLSFIAFGFLLAAAAKSAQFPFHTWLPDAMEAPSPVSALIHAATMVNAGVYLLARFYPAFDSVPLWSLSVTVIGMLSALLAALMALTAMDLKRALAYSTVSQLGYMVYAIGTGGVFASQFHLLSHAVFKALLFLAAGAVIHNVGTRDMRRMGDLGKQMPFARNVFIIGAAALAGLPFFNGFWSKELVLEAGLHHGPIWAYGVMLFGAGLTAFYTARTTWLVFFGRARDHLHAHPTGQAMQLSLGLLAFGALTTWLLAGPFSAMLAETLPHHDIHELGLLELAEEVFLAWPTYLALTVVGIGMAAWFGGRKQATVSPALLWLEGFNRTSFGFDPLNRAIASLVMRVASVLQRTQTGKLNWNIVGLVTALAAVLAFLIWSA